jgi:hypothetical protein
MQLVEVSLVRCLAVKAAVASRCSAESQIAAVFGTAGGPS